MITLNNKKQILFLLDLYKIQKWKILSFFLLSLFLTFISTLIPLLFKYFLDNINTVSNIITTKNLIIYGIIIVLYLLIMFFSSYLDGTIVSKSNFLLRERINTSFGYGNYELLKKDDINIVQIITNDVPICQSILNSNIFNIVIKIITFITILIIMISINIQLTLTLLISSPLYYLTYTQFNKRIYFINNNIISYRDKLSKLTMNIESQLFQYKCYAENSTYYQKYNSYISTLKKLQNKKVFLKSLVIIVNAVIFIGLLTTLVIIGSKSIEKGILTVGSFVAILLYAFQFFAPIREIMSLFINLKSSTISIERVYNLINIEKEKQGSYLSNNSNFNIVIDNTNFSTPDGKKLLTNVNATFNEGETNLIIGGNGAGKSTIVLELLNFYNCKEGDIFLGKYKIEEFSNQCLRKMIAVSFQKVQFVADTVIEQINSSNKHKFIKPNKNDFEVVNNITNDFVSNVGGNEKINNLSGGNKQILSFISTLNRFPKIIILDETLSNLDEQNKVYCLKIINKLKKSITFVVIDHNLKGYITRFDNIIKIDEME